MVLAILRAESLSEVPVIGRMIAASDRRAHAALENAGPAGIADTGASLLPAPDQCEAAPAPDSEPDMAPVLRSAVGPKRS